MYNSIVAQTSSDLIDAMKIELADVRAQNRRLEAKVCAYGTSHLDILSGPAIRYELAQLTTPVDLLVYDWRKMHEWIEVLTWTGANVPMGRLARVDYAGIDRRHAARRIDLRGQYGGDETVIAVDPGDGRGLLRRLLRELSVMNALLTPAQISEIMARTGGLISGFCVAAVLVEGSFHALQDAARAVDATEELKTGHNTGSRATSGTGGTQIGILTAIDAADRALFQMKAKT